MKNTLLLLFLSLSFHCAKSQIFQWAAKDHWYELDGGKSICTDHSGNVYVVSEYKSSTNQPPPNSSGSILSKYNSEGILLWSLPGISGELRLDIDINNNPVITGYNADGNYIAKYDPSGNLLWLNNLNKAIIRGISFDAQNNYYITGGFNDTISFGNIILYNSTYDQFLFIAKFNSYGNCLWAKQSTNGHLYQHTCLNVDSSGNSYIGGDFIGTLTIDNFSITSAMFNAFVVMYNSSGIAQWVYNINGSQQEWVSSLSADNRGNVYAVGFYDNPLTVGNSTLPINGQWWNDTFIIKFNSSGTPLWAKQIGGNEKDFAEGVRADNDGNLFISGSFSTAANFGSITLSNTGHLEPFIAKYDSLGNCQWAIQTGGNGVGEGIALDDVNNIFVTGSFGALMNFGGNSLSGIPNSMFLTKIHDNTLSEINESENSPSLTVYPNPTVGVFQISYFSTEKNKLQLNAINSVGETVYRESFQGNYNNTLDLSKQAKGVYFIEIISANKKRKIRRIVLN